MANDGVRVLREATGRLRQSFNVYFSTIQLEEQCLSDEEPADAIDITNAP